MSCCGNSLKLAVSFEFKNRVSRTRLNETCLNPPLQGWMVWEWSGMEGVGGARDGGCGMGKRWRVWEGP